VYKLVPTFAKVAEKSAGKREFQKGVSANINIV
jgi:hypothetical protein